MIIIFKLECALILLLLSLICIKIEHNDYSYQKNNNSIKKYDNNEILHERFLHKTQQKNDKLKKKMK